MVSKLAIIPVVLGVWMTVTLGPPTSTPDKIELNDSPSAAGSIQSNKGEDPQIDQEGSKLKIKGCLPKNESLIVLIKLENIFFNALVYYLKQKLEHTRKLTTKETNSKVTTKETKPDIKKINDWYREVKKIKENIKDYRQQFIAECIDRLTKHTEEIHYDESKKHVKNIEIKNLVYKIYKLINLMWTHVIINKKEQAKLLKEHEDVQWSVNDTDKWNGLTTNIINFIDEQRYLKHLKNDAYDVNIALPKQVIELVLSDFEKRSIVVKANSQTPIEHLKITTGDISLVKNDIKLSEELKDKIKCYYMRVYKLEKNLETKKKEQFNSNIQTHKIQSSIDKLIIIINILREYQNSWSSKVKSPLSQSSIATDFKTLQLKEEETLKGVEQILRGRTNVIR